MNLKPIQYYNDEYDRLTVAMCRQREQKHRKVLEGAKTGEEQIWHELLFKLLMFYDTEMFAGERWENKKQGVEEQMARDRARDTLLATAEAPEPIHCLTCRAEMKVIAKEIDETGTAVPDRVIFFFECPNRCKPRRVFFNTGEEFRPKVATCPKCKSEMNGNVVREKDEVIMTDTCTQCGHVETTQFSTAIKPTIPDPDFMKDYKRFCYTDEQGKEYLENKANQDRMLSIASERERKSEKRKLADRLAKIKKITVNDVEGLLSAGLEKEQYGRLHLSAPEIRRFFIVSFTIQKLKVGRTERDAIVELRVLMQKLLAPTNWRLMSDGICNQLGVLTGRLRGYDKEHELIELIEKKDKKAAKPSQ